MKNYEIKFPDSFIKAIDSILIKEYSKETPREAFFKFFYLIEKFSMYETDRKYASIHNETIRKLLGTTRIDKKKIQIASKVIDKSLYYNIVGYVNHHFNSVGSAKNYTRKYYFTDAIQYKQSDIIISGVEIDKESADLIKKEHQRPTVERLRLQYDLLKSDRVSFDLHSAINWVHSIKDIKKLNENQVKAYTRMAISFWEKNIFVSEDNRTKRIFSNITGVKREFRCFMKIDEESLASYDLKSAQPYLLASKYLQQNPDNTDVISFFNDITQKDIYTHFYNEWIKINGSSKYLEFNMEKGFEEMKDMSVYIDGIKDDELTRKETKIQFQRLLFKKINGSVPFQIVLQKLYPTVFTLLQKDKVRCSKISDTHNLAIELQEIESSIFIPVATELINEGVLSCHDSLYFKESLKDKVNQSLINKFNSMGYTNYTIKFEITSLTH